MTEFKLNGKTYRLHKQTNTSACTDKNDISILFVEHTVDGVQIGSPIRVNCKRDDIAGFIGEEKAKQLFSLNDTLAIEMLRNHLEPKPTEPAEPTEQDNG